MPTTLCKPAGLTVFPPHHDPQGDCLCKQLLTEQPWRRDIAWPAGYEGGIAHRLDNSTSGAVLVADSLDELAKLRTLFSSHQFIKTYLFLTPGSPTPAPGSSPGRVTWRTKVCDLPIAHHPTRKNRMVVQLRADTPHRGKWYPAHTEFRHLHGWLWEARITTGVMHQIRAHAGALGIPVLGDRLYGGTPRNLFPTGNSPQMRFYLHHVGLMSEGVRGKGLGVREDEDENREFPGAGVPAFSSEAQAQRGAGVRSDPVPLPDWSRAGIKLAELLVQDQEPMESDAEENE